MASRLTMPGSLTLIVVALAICAFAANVDAHKCKAGWATCTYRSTCKTNLWSDLNNCGRCGSKCMRGPHATSKCTKGRCSFVCDKKNGWCDCDGNHRNGCEVNTKTDKKNCGKCGHVCRAPLNFIASCVTGVCRKDCKTGYKQCGNTCVKVTTDVNNCGSCGNVCPTSANFTTSCVGGACILGCKGELTKCSEECVDLSGDILNCGGCGNICPTSANSTTLCIGGTCSLGCQAELTNCSDVCVDLKADVLNCGTCGNVCPADFGPLSGPVPATRAVCTSGVCGTECFPGDATVTLSNGEVKRMFELALGDKVAVRGRDGNLAYEDVYAFGHRDAIAISSFVQLTVKPIDANMTDPTVESRTLELTDFHFVPVSSGKAGKLTYKRARDVTEGDKMWAEGTAEVVVTHISRVQKEGLYNPFTLSGTIIVNGVLASSHSEWFLDDLFQALGLVQWLPSAYQTLLLPVRMLYSALGKDAYLALYRRVDALVDVAAFGTKHAGSVVTISAAMVFVVMNKISRRA